MSFQACLQYLISWILRIPRQSITTTTDLRRDLDLDKFDFELLIFQLERYYHIEFSKEQIQSIETVQDLGRVLRSSQGHF